jgi:hypothetical protein
MAGWSSSKRKKVEQAFYLFLHRCYINSKDSGRTCLGEHLYEGQVRTITQIFDALEADIHEIYILKSRQLGISTLVRALVIFLLGVLPGLKGAIVFDTDQNKTESRAELEVMINDLPPGLRFSKIKGSNRTGLTLENESKVLFMAAGVRKMKTSGTLGRSVGLSLCHCSELCSWDNDDGLEAFRNSLSDNNPDRLYIYESTARGPNTWCDMWTAARADATHCKCIFLGWWSKDQQQIKSTDPDWPMYGEYPPTNTELKKILDVKKLYGYDISPEQLAWYRRKMDPAAIGEAVGQADNIGPLKIQEQPWTEDEAFQQTGAVFFGAQALTDVTAKWVSKDFKRYLFAAGQEFFDMRAFPAYHHRDTQFKVWEEPQSQSSYVVGIDPAYGENEKNDRSAIQVLKCYADGIDQVAEYAWPLITTEQFGWVVAAILGWYGKEGNEVRYVLELNGPGTAVFNELRSLKYKIEGRLNFMEYEERGLRDIFRNVKTYIWSRPDSMGTGHAWHIKTTTQLKVAFMERLRDFVTNGLLRVRSMDVVEEMKKVERAGDSIGAPGSQKDDRVLALAFAVHCWEEKARRQLITTKTTRQAEAARKSLAVTDRVALYQENQLASFFSKKRMERSVMQRQAAYSQWRSGMGRRY